MQVLLRTASTRERVFRENTRIMHRDVEHLGNWHTHHVNGLQHLSDGDIATYHRNVNHRNHNTSFFYALLVTAKRRSTDPLRRYTVKHYVFRRGDERIYELRPDQKSRSYWMRRWSGRRRRWEHRHTASVIATRSYTNLASNPNRAHDNDILSEFYLEGIRPFSSAKLGMYWRGPLELLDGSKVEVVLPCEDTAAAANPPIR